MHLFVIPDGNRRWERARNLPMGSGHVAGYEVLKSVLSDVWDLGVSHLTFWALSRDNKTKRSPEEICLLMDLLKHGLGELGEKLAGGKDKVRFRVVGDTAFNLPVEILRRIEEIEKATKDFTDRHFTLLLMYDFRWEMLCAQSLLQRTTSCSEELDWERIRSCYPTGFLPDVDLMIRSDRPHLSGGALAIQMIDPEFYFTPDRFWPDYTLETLKEAITNFRTRERRLGT